MNKDEFLRELSSRLYSLPKEERDSALKYYEELFEEAGPEGETGVLAGLGSPREAADSIISDFYGKKPEEAKKMDTQRRNSFWLMLLLAILALPLILPVAGTLFGVIVAIVFTALGITIAAGAVILALIVSGIAVCITGVVLMFTSPAVGIFVLGVGLILGGLGLLFVIPFFAFFVNLVPAVINGIVGIGKRLFGKRRVSA